VSDARAAASDIPIGGMPDATPVYDPTPYADLPDQLREALRARVDRLGYLGAFFAFTAAQPDALHAFNSFSESLRAELPDNLSETVALAISAAYGNDYENVQHRRLAATHGRAPGWIAAVCDGGDEDQLDEAERAVRALVSAMVTGGGKDARPLLERVHALLGRKDTVGVLLLAARYIGHSHVSNVLELTAPPVRR
jgi:alkylhydroperoxidase family enzyme